MRTLLKEVNGLDWGDAAVMNCEWRGPRLRDILLAAGVSKESGHVAFACYKTHVQGDDWYGASIELERALRAEADVLVALEMNGAPLPAKHGYPVRIIVPGVSGCRSVKWLDRITVQSEESTNLYQRYDYKRLPAEATDPETARQFWDVTPALQDMPINSVIAVPQTGQTVTRSPDGYIRVKGYALPQSGQGPVLQVEVSPDEGRTWQNADIVAGGEKESKWAWSLWETTVRLEKGKCRRLLSRATDRDTPILSTRPSSPEQRPLSPGESGTFLTELAAQERRVLELKEELQKAELELDRLKKEWAAHGVAQKTSELGQLEQLGHSENKLAGLTRGREDNATRATRELDRRKLTLPSAKTYQRKVLSGSRHTRTLSLLSTREPMANIASISQAQVMPSPSESTRNNICISSASSATLPSRSRTRVGSEFYSSQDKDAILKSGKQLVGDFRHGLWTFLEDLRQVTVGEDVTNFPGRSNHDGSRGVSRATTTASRGRSGVRDPTRRQNTNNVSLDESKYGQHDMGTEHYIALTNNIRENGSSESDDDGWDNWESPLIKSTLPGHPDPMLSPPADGSSPRTSMK
ncbi:MAG: hypothetical protein Q9163_001905 [Psora crenata]